MSAGQSEVKTKEERIWSLRDSPSVLALIESGLPGLLKDIDSGRFGTTMNNLLVLEELARSLDFALDGYEQMTYHLTKAKGDETELSPMTLEERRFAGFFALLVFCRSAGHSIQRIVETPQVTGALSREGLDDLAEEDPEAIVKRLAVLLTMFLRREIKSPRGVPLDSDRAAAETVHVFTTLLSRAVDDVSRRGRMARLREISADSITTVGGEQWRGLLPHQLVEMDEGSALREVESTSIVGNLDYLNAGLKLARDVAGFDFEIKRNPKQFNPILFALGPPGCGKTLVAHAVGNYFKNYCLERGIRSKFTVIRRTDWASSYQNASAANLIRIFKELHTFDGVVGIYWADIDTALASRDQNGLRAEEKASLSAAFNIFDGTLIPFDGKWFMICDANNLEMDEALRTRIAKNPFRVVGPESPEDYVRLLRDILLREFRDHLLAKDAEWISIGESAFEAGISGRGMEGISRQVIDRIQDFEYPDEYYEADYEERLKILATCAKPISAENLKDIVDRYVHFEKGEEERLSKQRFESAVNDAVFGLNVQREMFNRAGDES
ncbi:MAG: AAA family ATPase [Deltaproteobacteria bacterium]|nr:AAA family ATPase [Deltaproteobacteria bacterium]